MLRGRRHWKGGTIIPRNEGSAADTHPDLLTKVGAWLQTEGYPLEFATASAFHKAGFNVLQAEYTKPTPSRPRREVDVVAHMTVRDQGLLRVEFVVECKWSADKPWVFFCGTRGMTIAASATQTMGSRLAELLMWKEAGNPAMATLGMFMPTGRSAFGGRQAFSKSTDLVFDVVRAVTSNCRALADAYDYDVDRAIARAQLPANAVAMFPVIVVDGRLFEASAAEEGLDLEEVPQTRVHFRGAERHRYAIATVDVVRSDHVETFARERAKDSTALLGILSSALTELRERTVDGQLERLEVTRGSRGMTGTPPLLAALRQARAAAERSPGHGADEPTTAQKRDRPPSD